MWLDLEGVTGRRWQISAAFHCWRCGGKFTLAHPTRRRPLVSPSAPHLPMLRKLFRRPSPGAHDEVVRRAAHARSTGDLTEAGRMLRDHLAAHPEDAAALHELGVVSAASGKHQEALACFVSVLARHRDWPGAARHRAHALLALGRADEAAQSYESALAAKPDDVESLEPLGHILLSRGRPSDAIAVFERALRLRDDLPTLHLGRASGLLRTGRPQDALAEFEIALECAPESLDAALGCAAALHFMGRTPEALAVYERVQTQFPAAPAIPYNRGVLLRALGRREDAIASLREAVARDPSYRDAWHNLGIVLSEAARYREAAQCAERLVALDPHYPHALGNLAYWRAAAGDWRDRDHLVALVKAGLGSGKTPCVPFVFLTLSQDADEQRACAVAHTADRHPHSAMPLCTGVGYEHRRLRVAYVSADFREHAVSYLMAGLLERHDRESFEVYGIALGGDDRSPMRGRVASACEHFLDVGGRSDAEVAALLRSHEIDIAVDLMGHTGQARPGIFALRPAPVQVNYLGYPGTIGADYIDYILADPWVIPRERRDAYTEKVVYLPDVFQSNDRDGRPLPAAAKRADVGLPEGPFVFCCFNNTYKIAPPTFDAWMRTLGAVRDSVLWLVADDPKVADNLRREAALRGVAPERLHFAARAPYATYLARLALADVFLDSLPFNGGTTVSDALWAGVPVVTQSGDGFAARMATSLLHAVGLPELVARSSDEYEALAVQLAREPATLSALRERLLSARCSAPLFDTPRFCMHLEAAYRIMVDRALAHQSPAHFAVSPVPRA